MKIGILALQGAVAAHKEKLAKLGVDVVEVRTPADLAPLAGIIIPGGESTTMIHLLKRNRLWDELQAFVCTKPSWGVCAGMILLAGRVQSPAQESFGAIDLVVERNAYGRQTESFIGRAEAGPAWAGTKDLEAVFIRAPRIEALGHGVRVLFTNGGEPVMVENEICLVSSFHPELSASDEIHRYFVEKIQSLGKTPILTEKSRSSGLYAGA